MHTDGAHDHLLKPELVGILFYFLLVRRLSVDDPTSVKN